MTAGVTEPHIGLVVEGAGDVRAVPTLLRSYLHSVADYRDILGKPIPVHGKGNATAANGIEGYVTTAALRPGCVGVLVILDGDDECPAEVGPALAARAASVTQKPVRLVLAEKDFEDWLYASIETLGLGSDLTYDPTARGLSMIKNALRPSAYAKPTWQPRLAARVELKLASGRSASFARLLAKFEELRAGVP